MQDKNKVTEKQFAFPCGPLGAMYADQGGYTYSQYPGHEGMTLQQWYAGRVLSSFDHCVTYNDSHMRKMAEYSAKMADMMIAALERGTNETDS